MQRFPADEAGISAYVKAKASIPNLDVVKPVLATIEHETEDYIIGTVAMDYHTEEQYPHVYVSTDGYLHIIQEIGPQAVAVVLLHRWTDINNHAERGCGEGMHPDGWLQLI